MPLDYQLSSDSPLLHPDAPKRVFDDPQQYIFCQRMKNLRELGYGPDKLFSENFNADILKKPVYSVLTQEEADDLLTPAGTVWFLSQATDSEPWECTWLYEAGCPGPFGRMTMIFSGQGAH